MASTTNNPALPLSILTRIITALAVLIAIGPVAAQELPENVVPPIERGFASDKAYQYLGIDSVDLSSGAVTLTIPIGPRYPVNGGFSYGLTLVHNSSVWDFETIIGSIECGPSEVCPFTFTQAFPTRSSNAGLGWRLTMGELFDPADTDNPNETQWVFVSGDGAEHQFFHELHEGEEDPDNQNTWYTHDGSYLRMIVVNTDERRIEFPNGTQYKFVRDGVGSVKWHLGLIEDPHGNFVSIWDDEQNNTRHIVDSQGRTHTIEYVEKTVDGENRDYVRFVNLEGFDNQTSTYEFHYSDVSALSRSAQDDDHYMISPQQTSEYVGVSLLSRLELPETVIGGSLDSRSYSFAYCLGLSCSGFVDVADSPGMLESVRFPSGGGIKWEFQTWSYIAGYRESGCQIQLPVETCQRTINLEWAGIKSKSLTDRHPDLTGAVTLGTWSYDTWVEPNGSTAVRIPEERRTIVTTPEGDDTAHYFRAMPKDPESDDADDLAAWDYGLPYTRRVADSGGDRHLSVEHYDGGTQVDSNDPHLLVGTKLRSGFVEYHHDEFDPVFGDSNYRHINRHLKSQKTLFYDDVVDDGGTPSDPDDDTYRFAAVDHSDFDGLGHFRTATTSGNFDSGNIRTTTVAYNNTRGTYPTTFTMLSATDPWVLGTFAYREQTEDGVTARQDYCFDQTTGVLLRRRTIEAPYVSTSSLGADDLVEVFTYDGTTGNRTRDSFYGGDLQAVGVTSDLCSLQLPSSEYYRIDHAYSSGALRSSQYYDMDTAQAFPFYSVEREIDSSTGFVSRTYDVAGLYTDYEYDARFRLVWEKPETGLSPGNDAWTEYEYVPYSTNGIGPEVEIYRWPNGSASGELTRSGYEYDPLGRLIVERQLLPDDSWTSTKTDLNAQGWVLSKSMWGNAAKKTVFSDFDPFGRAATVTLPDGKVTTHDYVGVSSAERTVQVYTDIGGTAQERDSVTTEYFDRQGRTWKLVEPAGSSGADVTTSYGYDVGGRLDHVAIASGSTTQNRYFNHDNRGFLVSEQAPELGSTGNGFVVYSSYDPLGNAGRVEDGASDLLYSYDRAGRITGIEVDTSCGPTPISAYTYGTANTTGNWVLGKLHSVSTDNYSEDEEWMCDDPEQMIFATLPNEIFSDGFESGDTSAWSSTITIGGIETITQTYTYGGIGGRTSSLTTEVGGDTFTQTFAWSELGQITSLGYPDLSGYSEPAGAISSVTYQYTNGYLTGVPGYASSITYHPNGAMSTVQHANGVDDIHGMDPDWMMRPQRIKARRSSVDVWDTGSFAYDGAGNVTHIGADSFVYDKVSRLTSGTAVTGTLSQAYTYDGFGNITSITDSQGTRSISVDTPTNRLASPTTYDAAGNLISWGDFTHDWRPTGELRTRISTGINKWFEYAADGERIVTNHLLNNTSIFTLRDLNGKVLRVFERDGDTWSWKKDYVYRSGLLLSGKDPLGTFHFTLDHLGTPRYVSDASGNGIAEHAYYGFGEEATTGWSDEMLKFTGHERDLEGTPDRIDDLDYMHARYYNPGLGRFLSLDPVEGDIASGQSWNRYAYVQNNPLNYVDPTGKTIHVVFRIGDSELSREDLSEIQKNVRALFSDANVDVVFHEYGAQTIPQQKDLGTQDRIQTLTFQERGGSYTEKGTSNSFVEVNPEIAPSHAGFILDMSNTITHELIHGTGVMPQYDWHDANGALAAHTLSKGRGTEPLGGDFYLNPKEKLMSNVAPKSTYERLLPISSSDKAILDYYFGRR